MQIEPTEGAFGIITHIHAGLFGNLLGKLQRLEDIELVVHVGSRRAAGNAKHRTHIQAIVASGLDLNIRHSLILWLESLNI